MGLYSISVSFFFGGGGLTSQAEGRKEEERNGLDSSRRVETTQNFENSPKNTCDVIHPGLEEKEARRGKWLVVVVVVVRLL